MSVLRHSWRLSPAAAVALQRELCSRVRLQPVTGVERVLGLDCAFSADRVLAVGVVWDVARACVVETRGASAALTFPYVPGLLSFRELPALLQVVKAIRSPFEVIMCDGQGIAHPRRFGIASHLGVLLETPALGCAKSRLTGVHEPPDDIRGAFSPLLAKRGSAEQIGAVLRTRVGVKPLYISPGHLCDTRSAVRIVLSCVDRYRLPEPTRRADRLVAKFKRDGFYRGGVLASGVAG